MAVRQLDTTCPDCGGQRRCDGPWHLDAGRHVPLDGGTQGAPVGPALLPVAMVGAMGGAVLLVLSWWWLVLLLPSLLLLALAVRG